MNEQPELFSTARPISSQEVEWFVDFLKNRDWMTAHAILTEIGKPVSDAHGSLATETTKRSMRSARSQPQASPAWSNAGLQSGASL